MLVHLAQTYLLAAGATASDSVPAPAPVVAPVPVHPRAPALDDWSRFRGPDGSGVAAEGWTAPVHFGPGRHQGPDGPRSPGHHQGFAAPVPPGVSSPCVAGDSIFLTAYEGEQLLVLGLDRATGRERWRRALKPEKLERTHELHGPASSTPVSDGTHVVSWFGSFGLICHDLDGEERWRRPHPAVRNTFGSAASPILHQGRLVLCKDQIEGSSLEVLDVRDGRLLWHKDRPGFGSGWSTPMVWRRGTAEQPVDELVVYGVWWLNAYDLADGAERWSVPGLADEPCITPVHGDGLLYVSSYNMRTNPEVLGVPDFGVLAAELDRDGDGAIDLEESKANRSVLSRADADGEGDHPLRIFFRMLDKDRDGGIEAAEWGAMHEWLGSFQHRNALVALRPGAAGEEPELVWQAHRGIPECPSPLVLGGHVYLVKNGGLITCLDAATGAQHYQERLDSGGPYYASPVACGGRIYAASARGVISVIEAGDRLEVLARNDLGERIMATPAFDGRRILVRTEGHLYAFEATDADAQPDADGGGP